MNDKELLELAAKAVGIEVLRCRLDNPLCKDMLINDSYRNPMQVSGPWNPLTDDGDALRLAVKLGIDVWRNLDIVWCNGIASVAGENPYETTRRAIVRAAAEIARMK